MPVVPKPPRLRRATFVCTAIIAREGGVIFSNLGADDHKNRYKHSYRHGAASNESLHLSMRDHARGAKDPCETVALMLKLVKRDMVAGSERR